MLTGSQANRHIAYAASHGSFILIEKEGLGDTLPTAISSLYEDS